MRYQRIINLSSSKFKYSNQDFEFENKKNVTVRGDD